MEIMISAYGSETGNLGLKFMPNGGTVFFSVGAMKCKLEDALGSHPSVISLPRGIFSVCMLVGWLDPVLWLGVTSIMHVIQ
jgi:hypothetical protein